MAESQLTLNVRVNSETGQLEIVGQKLQQTSQKAKETQSAFSGLTGQAGSLLKSFLPFATAGGITAFFVSAVKGAEEQNEAFRRLKFSIESSGQSWEANRKQVENWTVAVANSTRFSDGEAILTLEKFQRTTGSLAQAQQAATLAMNLSVASGKDLTFVTRQITDLINGEQGALVMLKREFGDVIGNAQNTQDALDALTSTYKTNAQESKGLTDSSSKLTNSFGMFKDAVGNAVIPALTAIVDFTTRAIQRFDQFALIIASFGAKAAAIFGKDTKKAWAAIDEETSIAFNEIQDKITRKLETSTNERLLINDAAREKEQVKREEANLKEEETRRSQQFKIEQMEMELEMKLNSLGEQTLQKKLTALQMEVQARRAKINQEVKDEVAKQKLIDKLNEFEFKSAKILRESEVSLKLQSSFQIADLAVQTLQVVNSLGEKGSASERIRAKALLALQKSIAIGWAWVNAMKAGGPFAVGLASATTALIAAQFVQQMRQIDQASAREKSDLGSINISPNVPGIDLGIPEPGSGTGAGDALTSGGGGSLRSSGGGGGFGSGGGGGQTVIHVGGIVVNFDVDRLGTDNVDAVMKAMYEKLRQATIEGVQLAVTMNNLAQKNSTLAV